ncbi:hypothetical protein F5Y08DRAFT_350472 [Xylaria arbuscula]|nr:hypothetical protein F5Y08DRAFT_350472 [Xylaria arbuscula]
MTDDHTRLTIHVNRDQSQWPMTFSMKQPQGDVPRRRWWHHYYYRGPQGQSVQILYSRTRSRSETIARHFVNELVLGFDMEWPWDAGKRSRLQDKIALIQLASERKIALFHIALHEGETTDDLIAPTLKEIIESPKIFKAGVAVLNADFNRLRVHFKLEPKGAFELSHLHNLVTYGGSAPEHVTTKLRSLSMQVENHLGLPLWKGSVRTSDWSQPLNSDQTAYAATDAYAGFMLFHCMNAKRLAMNPTPPLPALAETYPFLTSKSATIRLEAVAEDGEAQVTTAEEFFGTKTDAKEGSTISRNAASLRDGNEGGAEDSGGVDPAVEMVEPTLKHDEPQHSHNPQRLDDRKSRGGAKAIQDDSVRTSMDSSCWALYGRLASHRKQAAVAKGVSAFVIAHNTLLQALSMHRPSNEQELLGVPGVGKRKLSEYGASWLEIITAFEAEQKQKHPDPKRRRIVRVGRSKEVLMSSGRPPAMLSTGISFQFGATSLAGEPMTESQSEDHLVDGDDNDSVDDDDDDAFGPPMQPPSPATLKRKRALAVQRESETNIHQQLVQGARRTPIYRTSFPPSNMKATTTPTTTNNYDRSLRLVSAPISTAMSTASHALNSNVPEPPRQISPENLSRDQMFLRKKLEAYVKSVMWAMHSKPTEPLISQDTLRYLTTTLPQTVEEFRAVPGIQRLTKACAMVKMDIWRTFEKWTRGTALAPPGASSSR